jgi:hypothetical protein
MIGQTRINDSDAIAETLDCAVVNGNDFRSVAIDVAPSPFALDGSEPFRIGQRRFEARRDYGFSSVINKPPGVSLRRGKERARTRRLATAPRDEQRENDRERDRATAIHPLAKIM